MNHGRNIKMSNLAQAQVTFLSKRCIQSPIWLRNAAFKSICLNSSSLSNSKSSIKLTNTITTTNGYDEKRPITATKIINVEQTNTPNISRVRRLVETLKSYQNSDIVLAGAAALTPHCPQLGKTKHLSEHTSQIIKDAQQLDAIEQIFLHYNISPLNVNTTPLSRFVVSSSRNSNENSNRHESRRRNKRRMRIPFALGALGIFKKLTIDDVDEEEKSTPSDEQKLKKMSQIEILASRGVLLMCDQEYDKAEILFHQALELAQSDDNEEQETFILNLLATNYFDSGQLDKAERLFIDLIKRSIALGVEQTDPAVLELSLKLSSIYSKEKSTHGKALKGFEFVIGSSMHKLKEILEKFDEIQTEELSEQNKNDLALLGWSYDWFAKHLVAINDYENAIEMLRRALEISSKILGPLHEQTLILLNDLGTTLAMSNLPEEGKTYIQRAVEGAIESKSRELVSFYVNLGLVNLQLRKLSEAKRYCEYSIELALKDQDNHNNSEIIKLSQICLNEVKHLLDVQS